MTDILDYLKAGERLNKNGDAIYCPNGVYHFAVWDTGEIGVSTEEIINKPGQINKVWSNKKKCSQYNYVCIQKDHNLVVYAVIDKDHTKPIWSSGTYRLPETPAFLMVEDDGSLSIYDSNDKKTKYGQIQPLLNLN